MTVADEKTQVLARDQTDDGRFYVLRGGTPQEERFRSVTAATSRWDKDGLVPWGSGLAAKAAFDILPELVAALLLPECGRTYGRCGTEHDWGVKCPDCRCRQCQPCLIRHMRDRHEAESHRRTDEGSRVHLVADHWVKTGVWLEPDEDIRPYVESFRAFIAEHGLRSEDWEMAEARVINRDYMYAGTLDAIVNLYRGRTKAVDDILDRLTADGQPRLQHALVLVDYKSRERPDRAVFMDMPLQLAGYRFAQWVVLADGTEVPLPQVDATAIIQVRPDRTGLELVLAEEPEFAAFLNLLGADEWALERGKRAIGARTFSYAPSVVKLRAADARRRSKEAKAQEGVGEPPPVATESTQEPTAAQRGARAAAAARKAHESTDGVWGDLATTHGRPVKVSANAAGVAATRRTETVAASVLGAVADGGEEPPF